MDIQELNARMRAGTATAEEQREFYRLTRDLANGTPVRQRNPEPDTRGYTPGPRGPQAGEIRGEAGETIRPGQAREWFNKAQGNGVRLHRSQGDSGYLLSAEGRDRDLNRYWGEKLGFAPLSVESRALAEDTVGSGQAINPSAWVADYIDVLLPNTVLGKVGAKTVVMTQETVNVPVYTSTVSPQWMAENGSIGLDTNPAFAPLTLFATGGFKDITQFSRELAQDAYIRGDLPGMLSEAIAKKMAVAMDTAAILGVTSNTGIPGLINESGFVTRQQTGDSGSSGLAPTDTTELGVVAEATLKLNAKPNAYVSNVGVHEAFCRIPVTSYGRYWELPAVAQDLDWITSENSALAYVETDALPPAQTGGSYSSLYCGPWDQFAVVGVRLDLQTEVLRERYADTGSLAIFSMMRVSIRYAHPETYTRTVGVISK